MAYSRKLPFKVVVKLKKHLFKGKNRNGTERGYNYENNINNNADWVQPTSNIYNLRFE